MRKDPYQRTIDPLKVYNDHGLTFEHLSYQAVPLDAIERFVSARRQAIIDLLKCPLTDGAQRQGIMQRTRDAWAQTLVAAQEAIGAPRAVHCYH